MIEVVLVKTNKQIKDFVNFPLKLYENCPYYVPELYGDQIAMIKKNKAYGEQTKVVYFNAYDDGKMVGRISGIIQLAGNSKWNQKRVRFTRFDCIDDVNVAHALFKAVETWGKEQKMEEICGPLGFSDLEREGLLIEGFNYLSTFEEAYNYDYYPKLVESYGFVKDIDWTERMLRAPKEIDQRYNKIGSMMLKKYNLHFVECKSTREIVKKYGQKMFKIIDETYDELYGTVPIPEKAIKSTLAGFKLLLDVKYIAIIVDENDDIVCFGFGIPSISTSVRDIKGKLFPFGFLKVLKEKNHPKVVDLALVGVSKKYRKSGVAAAIFGKLLEFVSDPNIDHFETNLNLEDNHNIANSWKPFDNVIHKRRRAYKKVID